MGKYIIDGGNPLSGEISIQGSKNATLPIMAASILCSKEVTLHNVPDISDVETMKQILTSLGCIVSCSGHDVTIDSSNLNENRISDSLINKMRSSIIVLGAICSRLKKSVFSYPGGCDIGLRPIDLHIKAFRDLGAVITEERGYMTVDAANMHSGNIVLNYPSVGATENLMLMSVFLNGVTTISNAAREPEIIDLQDFLNAMGARVYGAGGSNVYVEGVDSLNPCEYTIMSDRIATGTYLCLSHMCAKKVFLRNCSLDAIKAPYYKLLESGMRVKSYSDGLEVYGAERVKPIDSIVTLPYPAFPTDLQPIFVAMLTTASGTSIVKETVFESRYRFTSQLLRMGANIRVEGQLAIINGVDKLYGAQMHSQDLRGGAAIVLAALKAQGRSVVHSTDYIKRGYENFAKNLRALGAEIREI